MKTKNSCIPISTDKPEGRVSTSRFCWVLAIIMSTLSGCGLFYPADIVEYPDPKTTVDYFNFQGILTGTKERFSRLNNEDVFHELFHYINYGSHQFTKEEFVNRLKTLQSNYFDDIGEEIDSVKWQNAFIIDEPEVFNKSDTINLYRNYYVFGKSFQTSSDTIQSGIVRFKLVYHQFKNCWTIFSWQDEQNSPGLSLFNPDYRNE
jgi:hypothetical protein